VVRRYAYPDSREVPQRILDLAAQLAQAKPMRRGSLSERYVHAIEQCLNADLSDEASTRLPCPCGQEARYVARRTEKVVSVKATTTGRFLALLLE
jgi:hypothetical protein